MTLKIVFAGAGMDFNPTLPYLVVSNLEANKEYTFEVGNIYREISKYSFFKNITALQRTCILQ